MDDITLEQITESQLRASVGLLKSNRYADAKKLFQSAENLLNELTIDSKNKPKLEASILAVKGAIFHLDMNLEQAINYYNQSLNLRLEFYKDEPKLETANLLSNMGECFAIKSNYPQAFYYYNRSLEMKSSYNKIMDIPEISLSETYYNVGMSASNVDGLLNVSSEYLEKYLNTASENNIMRFKALGTLGSIYQALDNSSFAIKRNLEGLSVARDINLSEPNKWIAVVKQALGFSYNATGDYKNSIKYYNESLNTWIILNESSEILLTAATLFKVLFDNNNALESANISLIFLKEKIKPLEDVNISTQDQELKFQKANLLKEFANSYSTKGEYSKSIEYYKQALDFFANQNSSATMELLLKIAETYALAGNMTGMEHYYDLAENQIRIGSDADTLLEGADAIYSTYNQEVPDNYANYNPSEEN